jgi:hypothetical protein
MRKKSGEKKGAASVEIPAWVGKGSVVERDILEDAAADASSGGVKINGMCVSGTRQKFCTGAVRDADDSKPRMDLMTPKQLRLFGEHLEYLRLRHIADFMETNDVQHLLKLIETVIEIEDDGFLERCGVWLGKGAARYAARNWETGIPVSRYLASLLRHLIKWERDEDDEDHAAAIQFNIMGIEFTRDQVAKGLLPAELDDWPPSHWAKKEPAPFNGAIVVQRGSERWKPIKVKP